MAEATLTEEQRHERAQLWAIYFGMRGLKYPPPFVAETELALWQFLEEAGQPDSAGAASPPVKNRRRGHLSLVGEEEG